MDVNWWLSKGPLGHMIARFCGFWKQTKTYVCAFMFWVRHWVLRYFGLEDGVLFFLFWFAKDYRLLLKLCLKLPVWNTLCTGRNARRFFSRILQWVFVVACPRYFAWISWHIGRIVGHICGKGPCETTFRQHCQHSTECSPFLFLRNQSLDCGTGSTQFLLLATTASFST